MREDKAWFVYIVKCRDGRLYTGISNDIAKRIKAHNSGKGCKFTKYRFPVKLVYQEKCGTNSLARRRELEIQSFTRSKKLKLIRRYRLAWPRTSASQAEDSGSNPDSATNR